MAQRAMQTLESTFYGQGSYTEPADLMTAGGSVAVMGSGRNDTLEVVCRHWHPRQRRSGAQQPRRDAGFAYDMGYESWSAADVVNRYLPEQSRPVQGWRCRVRPRKRSDAPGQDSVTDIASKEALGHLMTHNR